jgi:hypothetical protein
MATKFSEFMRGVEEEARAQGPVAVAELEALRGHFRAERQHPQSLAHSAVHAKVELRQRRPGG